jgi:PAS domain S-box-containing protein
MRARVLHLDDSPLDAELVRERLASSADGEWDIRHVDTGGAFESTLRSGSFDLLLTDYAIPGYDGMTALRFARRERPDIPIIVISGTLSEEEAVACLKAGATDYLFKQRLQRLPSAAKRALAEAAERRKRERAEAAMQQLSMRLRELAETSYDVIWIATGDPPKIVYVGPSVERIWGRPPEAFFGNADLWLDSIHPEDRPEVARQFDEVVRGTAQRFEVEYRAMRPDGSMRWVLDIGARMAAGSDGEVSVSGVSRDITERRVAEEEVRRLNASLERTVEERTRELASETAKLRAVLETAADAIVAFDESGRVLSFNGGAERMLGHAAADVLGRQVADLVPARARPEIEELLSRIMRVEPERYQTPVYDVTAWRKDGTSFPARVTIGQGLDKSSRFFTAIIHDVSELTRRAAQAEAANRELEAFSYSVSHDLRAPLHAIHGFAQALSESHAARLDEEGRHYLKRILSGSERMDRLIEDMLSLSRIASADLVARPIDLTAIALEVLAEVRERDRARAARFHVEPGMRAQADGNLVRIALDNLVGNAWKFSARRPETVIEIGRHQADGGLVTFFVRDNGAGFDPTRAARLFDPFQRLHSQAEFAGSGVGLATVQRVIQRHGGAVWAESAVDAGATFYFTLPAALP